MSNVIVLPLHETGKFKRNCRRNSAPADLRSLRGEQEKLEEEVRQLRAAVQLYHETIRRLKEKAAMQAPATR